MSTVFESVSRRPVGVVGAGSIGRAFALLFAARGHSVRVFEPDEEQRRATPALIRATLEDLNAYGLIDAAPDDLAARIVYTGDLAEAVGDAAYVQECAPEDLSLKRTLFDQMASLAPDDCVLASSSSAMPVSEFATGLPGAQRCLVAHPGNPPYLIRVIELVPAPFTSQQIIDQAKSFLSGAGLVPVHVRQEVTGFVFNRLQGAVLREAYCLVRDGVASVEDIDRVMRDGLGLRWSVVGPFETVDLNTRGGIRAHAERLGPAYARMGAERGQDDPWTEEMVAEVETARRRLMPLEDWQARCAWRDRQLMALLAERKRRTDAKNET
ncbi:3-hydroxyacyl-CoA dehydrogenase [Eilatimonas milleporae]|uniref:3-hydroxyacyl-CoA dehydrogenase n=1 Tax=Eilatimonas milleporae TaxID=911205 RepID=A0A3M0CRH5_9PROT|nr:3-hydroxyacyl-CoA dehydrogenase [Eilatimonas milleporae]RMB12082.1 3-hydroxyacyl-CoA dehydrogenase [Eilatimonas milleporae]